MFLSYPSFRADGIKMRGLSLAAINAVIVLVVILLAFQLDLTTAATNHYLVLHPCLFPTHMRVVFSVTKELVRERIGFYNNRHHACYDLLHLLTERPSRNNHPAWNRARSKISR